MTCAIPATHARHRACARENAAHKPCACARSPGTSDPRCRRRQPASSPPATHRRHTQGTSCTTSPCTLRIAAWRRARRQSPDSSCSGTRPASRRTSSPGTRSSAKAPAPGRRPAGDCRHCACPCQAAQKASCPAAGLRKLPSSRRGWSGALKAPPCAASQTTCRATRHQYPWNALWTTGDFS